MKCIKINLPRDMLEVKLHVIADPHIGDPLCDMDRIRKRIEEIREDKAAYVLLNGDILNNATRTSVSDIYGETASPMKQLERAVALFAPIRDRIVGMTCGNHEFRTYKNDGIDLCRLMANELGCADKYDPEGVYVFLRFGDAGTQHRDSGSENRQVCYTLYATHGSGGGRKEGSKAVRLADMAGIVDADVYVHSHTHLPMVFRQAYFRPYIPNSSVQKVERLFVNTAASLGYGGYGQAQEYKPSSKVNPIIILSGNRKMMNAIC